MSIYSPWWIALGFVAGIATSGVVSHYLFKKMSAELRMAIGQTKECIQLVTTYRNILLEVTKDGKTTEEPKPRDI
jgi:hypothetical protein